MTQSLPPQTAYQRYHIATRDAPEVDAWPSRFQVEVGRLGLARMLLGELLHTRGDLEVVLSRPCLYGVFSGPVGGFAPRPRLCVGCLRCTTQHPDFVRVQPNPERRRLGDSYFTFRQVDAIASESEGGRVPVKGAGYRGAFGGPGWDGMWTDMSEIVRPTRDGIHGREFISTVVDIGGKPDHLTFDAHGGLSGAAPRIFRLPAPFAFDVLPDQVASPGLRRIFARAAGEIDSLAVTPAAAILAEGLRGPHIAPLVTRADLERLPQLGFAPRLVEVEMDVWEPDLFQALERALPQALVALRLPFASGPALLEAFEAGVRVFHLTADYHGQGADGFVLDLIRQAHLALVQAGVREMATLIGSGGIIAAEHLPKAILAGLDLPLLDSAPLVALQARFEGEFVERRTARARLPQRLEPDWGVQRLKNMAAAWRDQLLEILGAMGLREVRRLRGEMGRAMFQVDLEREAFEGIEGFPAPS